jgi:hypothetical protein
MFSFVLLPCSNNILSRKVLTTRETAGEVCSDPLFDVPDLESSDTEIVDSSLPTTSMKTFKHSPRC